MRVAKEIWEQMYGKMIAEKDFTILGFKKKLHFEVYDGFAYCENYYGNEYTLSFPMVEFVNKSNEIQDRIKEFLNMKEDEPYVINMNYVATYTAVVEGDFKDEGEALDAARRKAEDADINEFSLNRELESQIIERE